MAHAQSDGYSAVLNAFKEPPAPAKPKIYWWWLNGHVDTTRLLEELVAIKRSGINGVDIFDIGARAPNNPHHMIPAGPAFMGPVSVAAIAAVIRKATELNMEVDLSLSSSWNAGGSWVKPVYAGKSLYYSTVKLQGGGRKKITVPFPVIPPKDEKGKPRVIVYDDAGRPVYRKEVAVLAIPLNRKMGDPDTAGIVNVSRFFDSRKDELNWRAPEGGWEIQRYVCSNSGEQLKYYSDSSAGPIIDHFDSAAVRAHLMYFIDHLQPLLGDLSKTALKSFYLASFEATGSVWTGSLPEEFRKINGYDVYKYLPALFDTGFFDTTTAAKFRHDFNLTLSELMIHNHYGKAKEIANRYGLQLISESGGPGPPLHNVPVEALKALGALDVPRGEFWNKHAVYDKDSIDLLMLVKEIAAAAHIYHRKIVELESFTSFQNWNEGPFDLKPLADRAFCEGMNRVVVHGFSHNPPEYGYPGIVYHAGTHYNNKNVWWPKAHAFNEYLSRISAVMQETRFFADVLYYYGDRAPNFVTPKNTRFSAGRGYDYEVINTDVLLRELSVKDGLLTLPGGATFQLLALDDGEVVNPAVMEKLKALAGSGAVISGGPWNKVRPGVKPDFEYEGLQNGVFDFIHQQRDGVNYYFVRNTTGQWQSRDCRFRVTGRAPEIWDPVTGQVLPVTGFEQVGGQTKVPVTLAPYQSYFFVFGRHGFTAPVEMVTSTARKMTIDGPWAVSFSGKGQASDSAVFPTLASWTESVRPAIKYFSGAGTYRKMFSYNAGTSKNERLYLDLGDLSKVATVWLNGKELGIAWAMPYRFDVTDLLKNGSNDLRIEVINVWSNRITGDAIMGEEHTVTNLPTGSEGVPWSETPLVRSGLFGPVTIGSVTPVEGLPDTATYLSGIKEELRKVWPANRTINLVYHGHSVPGGYWHNHEVHTLESYPYLVLERLKARYPYAVINTIITAIGGENAVKGQERFASDVLTMRPDVLFIDYALNDRGVGLEKAKIAWEKMIQAALARHIKVILMTPSPDQRSDIVTPGNELEQHAEQIRSLARKYHTGLVDTFKFFQEIARRGGKIGDYMSHVNHPNKKGHALIADAILEWF